MQDLIQIFFIGSRENQNKIEEFKEMDEYEPKQGDIFGMKWW